MPRTKTDPRQATFFSLLLIAGKPDMTNVERFSDYRDPLDLWADRIRLGNVLGLTSERARELVTTDRITPCELRQQVKKRA